MVESDTIRHGFAVVRVVVPGGVIVEVTIGIKLLAGELTRIIACACLRSYSTKDIVLIADQGRSGYRPVKTILLPKALGVSERLPATKKGKQRAQL